MSENTGNKPVGALVPVVTILAILGILMFIAYDWVSGMSRKVNVPTGPGQQQMVEERIRPVGRVAIAGQDGDAEERVAAASDAPANGSDAADASRGDEAEGEGEAGGDTDAAEGGEAEGETAADDSDAEGGEAEDIDGEAVYRAACTVCHGAGIAGAPKTGEASAWEARLEQGMETLVRHAIEGFQGDAGVMPPRGGQSNLSDEEVQAAVQYMVDVLEE